MLFVELNLADLWRISEGHAILFGGSSTLGVSWPLVRQKPMSAQAKPAQPKTGVPKVSEPRALAVV